MQKRKSPIEGVRARGVRVAVPQADVVPSQRAICLVLRWSGLIESPRIEEDSHETLFFSRFDDRLVFPVHLRRMTCSSMFPMRAMTEPPT